MSDEPKQVESKVPLKRILTGMQNKFGPAVWVKKWVDYSAKYGMGYTLSNGCTGVYFNDHSKMVRFNEDTLIYLDRKGVDRVDEIATYSFS